MKKLQIILLVLLGAFALYAFIKLCSVTDEVAGWFFFGSIVGALMIIASIVIKYNLDKRPVQVGNPNGETPGDIASFNGIGQMMLAGFKFRETEESFVSYTFFSFFLPIFPTGCYRIRLLQEEQGLITNEKRWQIFCSEKSDALEILTIYLCILGIIIAPICFGAAMIFA